MKKKNKKMGMMGSKVSVNTNPNLAGPTNMMKNHMMKGKKKSNKSVMC